MGKKLNFTKEQKEQIVKLYQDGMFSTDIAKMFKCSANTICGILKRYGVTRSQTEINKMVSAVRRLQGKKRKKTKQEISDDELIRLYLEEKMSIIEIQKCAKICYQAVYKVLKRNNVPIRSREEAAKIAIEKGRHKTPWKPMENHIGWKGGRIYNRGYVRIKMPEHPRANKKGYVHEHIVVAEQMLGRPLKEGEVVHHINGIKDDNRPENLMVMNSREHSVISAYQGQIKGKTVDILRYQIRHLEQKIKELELLIEKQKTFKEQRIIAL